MNRVFWLVLGALALTAVVWLRAGPSVFASPEGSVTLALGQSATVIGNGCNLRVALNTAPQMRVRCRATTASAPRRPDGRITLNPGQKLILNANACDLVTIVQKPTRLKVSCVTPAATTVHVGPGGMFVYSQPTATINAGQTVEWDWDSSPHTVTSGSGGVPDNLFCSPNDLNCGIANPSSTGARYRHTFATAGTFKYYCAIHGPIMSATVQVNP
jgi:plastocyanin